jgi:hypothetical protein
MLKVPVVAILKQSGKLCKFGLLCCIHIVKRTQIQNRDVHKCPGVLTRTFQSMVKEVLSLLSTDGVIGV